MAIGDNHLDLIKAQVVVAEAVYATEATIVTYANIMEAMTGTIALTIRMAETICPIGPVMEAEVSSEDYGNRNNNSNYYGPSNQNQQKESYHNDPLGQVSNSGESTSSSRTNINNNNST